jgi:heme/copper-type cytochrome/quinol oxidase subunit 2
MEQDTLRYDSLENRPLPKWLTDQKEGLNTIQPTKIVVREDNSLRLSFALTGTFILLTVILLTIYILRKHKNQSS